MKVFVLCERNYEPFFSWFATTEDKSKEFIKNTPLWSDEKITIVYPKRVIEAKQGNVMEEVKV